MLADDGASRRRRRKPARAMQTTISNDTLQKL